jgi:hypothetical protein
MNVKLLRCRLSACAFQELLFVETVWVSCATFWIHGLAGSFSSIEETPRPINRGSFAAGTSQASDFSRIGVRSRPRRNSRCLKSGVWSSLHHGERKNHASFDLTEASPNLLSAVLSGSPPLSCSLFDCHSSADDFTKACSVSDFHAFPLPVLLQGYACRFPGVAGPSRAWVIRI